MSRYIIFLLIIFPNLSIGQINKEDINGVWITCNNDSLFYKSDTVKFYHDINYQYEANCCHYVIWKIEKSKKMTIENSFICTEPGRNEYLNFKERIKIVKKNSKQVLIVKRDGKILDTFLLLNFKSKRIERYPYDTKIMTLRRLSASQDVAE